MKFAIILKTERVITLVEIDTLDKLEAFRDDIDRVKEAYAVDIECRELRVSKGPTIIPKV